jgi:protein O-mannosyl-transferase
MEADGRRCDIDFDVNLAAYGRSRSDIVVLGNFTLSEALGGPLTKGPIFADQTERTFYVRDFFLSERMYVAAGVRNRDIETSLRSCFRVRVCWARGDHPPMDCMLTRTRIALLCAVAALAVSLPILRNEFAIDDIYIFVEQPAAHSLRNIPQFFAGGWGMATTNVQERALNTRYYRPVPTTLGALEFTLFGLHPAGYHLTSVLLHAATATLVALLLWQLTGGAVIATLLGGVLFAIHPVQSEAFCAACYQTTLLAGFFGTLTLVIFGRVLTRGPRLGTLVGLGTSLFLALVSKEESFAIPFFVLAWAALLRPAGWRRVMWPSAIAMAVPLILVLLLRHAFLVPSKVTYFADEPARVVVLTMVRVAGLYLEILVAPLRFCPFYDWFIIGYETGLSLKVVTGAAILCLAAGMALFYVRRSPLIALGIAWILLGLAPVSQAIPIIVVAAERFLYLPMLGWTLLVGLLLERGLTRARAVGWIKLPAAAVAILFVAYAARTLTRVPDWRSDETLNLATAETFPETPAPFLNLATYYERVEKNPVKALAALAEADHRAPGWPPALARAARLKAQISP